MAQPIDAGEDAQRPNYGDWCHAFLRAIRGLSLGRLPVEETVRWADNLYRTDSEFPPEYVAQREFESLQIELPALLLYVDGDALSAADTASPESEP